MVVCPKCRKPYTGRPALSRVDNKTDIRLHWLQEGILTVYVI